MAPKIVALSLPVDRDREIFQPICFAREITTGERKILGGANEKTALVRDQKLTMTVAAHRK